MAVDVNNMLQLYASMLHERRIIITSSKLSTVSPFPTQSFVSAAGSRRRRHRALSVMMQTRLVGGEGAVAERKPSEQLAKVWTKPLFSKKKMLCVLFFIFVSAFFYFKVNNKSGNSVKKVSLIRKKNKLTN